MVLRQNTNAFTLYILTLYHIYLRHFSFSISLEPRKLDERETRPSAEKLDTASLTLAALTFFLIPLRRYDPGLACTLATSVYMKQRFYRATLNFPWVTLPRIMRTEGWRNTACSLRRIRRLCADGLSTETPRSLERLVTS